MQEGLLTEILVTEEEIQEICERLGKQITQDYADKDLLVVGVLKGCVPFLTDLTRKIDLPCQIDFMAVSSYGGGIKSSGQVSFKKDLEINPQGRDILIVEDILDSGLTLSYLRDILYTRGAKSIKICTFLDKPANRKIDITPDYCGTTVPDEFVVGYGLDYDEKYRNLSCVGVLSPAIYSK